VSDRARVLVVGAGLAGLGAAWRLARRGFDVVVCERAAAAGGRLRSLPAEGGFSIDAGCPVLSSADRELHAFAEVLGLRDELLPLRPLVRAQVYRGRVRVEGWRTPGIPPHQALRLLRLPRLLARYAPHLGRAAPGRAALLDDRSLGDFARLYFGGAVLERWAEPLLDLQSPADPERASRALFLRRHRQQAGARAGLPRAPLAELSEAAAKKLELRCESEVVRVAAGARGRLQVAVGRAARVHEVSALVVATPAAEAARILAPLLVTAEREFLARTRYAAELQVAVALRRPLYAHPLWIDVPRSEGSPLAGALLEPGVAGGRVPPGRGLALLRARSGFAERHLDAPDEVLAKELFGAFARFLPGTVGAELFTRVLRDPAARPRFDVGRYREISRFEDVQAGLRRAGRRVYFAGDYLMDPTWEGALLAARQAARAVEEDVAPRVG